MRNNEEGDVTDLDMQKQKSTTQGFKKTETSRMKQTSKLSFKEQPVEEVDPMKPIYD